MARSIRKRRHDAIDRPLAPRAAIKRNGPTGQGSCVAVVKRLQTKERTLNAMLDEAKGANCDGALSVQLTPGIAPGRVGNAQFNRWIQADRQCGRDRRRCSRCGTSGS